MGLDDFLIKAKTKTYASGGESAAKVLGDGCKEFKYEEKGWEYRDRYYGAESFCGEEIVEKNGKAVWGMNYFGRLLKQDVPAREVYEFLKQAMLLVKKDRPFRGPKVIKQGDFIYRDKNKGDISAFEGAEIVFYKNKKIYELKYHGGKIKN